MIKHISARIAWHNEGWNGHICKNPRENTYCVGRYSYPGEMIAERRDLNWEIQENIVGSSCAKLDKIPPCTCSINAFGTEKIKTYSEPPVWFKDGSQTKHWDLPPSTVCIWPYEEMYKEEVKNPKDSSQTYNYEKRLENAKKYFSELTPDKSLIFYYANYSNPFSEDDAKKYVIVGISRLKSMGEYLFYNGISEENKKKYAGGFVWQKSITSHYPDQGFRLPYHVYRNNPEVLSKMLCVPENDRNFKYATRHISDDDALDLIENFVETLKYLDDIGDTTENWKSRIEWLQSLIAELWQNRGAYPGLPKILDYLCFHEGIQYFKNEVRTGNEKDAKESIFSFLNGKIRTIPGLQLGVANMLNIQRQWKLRGDEEQKLLSDILPRFELSKDQIEKILSSKRDSHGIYAILEEIYRNPYILSEQFVGDNPDDRITFNKIDHGVFLSPELGTNNLAEVDDWRRFRGLCVEQLKKEDKHTFVDTQKLIHDINHKLSFFPEWKRHQFHENYFKVDVDELSESLTLRELKNKKFVYLKTVYEDEREVEKQIRLLAKRPDIVFKSPMTEKNWHKFLYESESPIAQINPAEYDDAIKGQIEVCKKVFTEPICIISGAAGTGKTTIIKALINAIENVHGSSTPFQLLAPTGKAAVRIREKTGKQASTIHSFLAQRGWLNDNLTFKRDGGAKEEGITTYIIDESSMLDLSLVATLFRAINWATVQRLIFIGDPNQLPPIGRGHVFADIIEWLNQHNPDSIGILRENIRQRENKLKGKGTGILDLASIYIRENVISDKPEHKCKVEELLKRMQEGDDVDKDLRVLYWKNADELEKLIIDTIISDMEKRVGEDFNENKPYDLINKASQGDDGNPKADAYQVMSPYRGELFGIENLNLLIQMTFNKLNTERRGALGGITFFDKVIQYVNRPKSNPYWAYNCSSKKNEEIEIYNGELGFVKPHAYDKNWTWEGFYLKRFQVVFSQKKEYWIEFLSDNDVEQNLELAYAISVHKAQGSEFERVYFVLPKNKKSLLSTELLYTGITRAQKHLTLFVEEDISPFLSLRRPEKSHLLGINSSLFQFQPLPEEILTMNNWYEEGKVHQTLSDYMVRSKSEIIIANILHDRNIPFKYEVPLFASDGTFYLPDFTITWNGEKWYWEHLGLLDSEEYRNHWEAKKQWYEKHFPCRLVITKESHTLSKDAEDLINKYFSV